MDALLENVELTMAVQGLRDQLLAAVAASDGQELKFAVEEIALDFTVELRRDAGAKLGFKAWVVSGDAQSNMSKAVTHKVSLRLRPMNSPDGELVSIGNDTHADMSLFDEGTARDHGA
ncbi:trypco2 family protein [Streptomyces monticola]|uniref:Trypco2 family protein n=1 Tax=Streptomyces monticola TaxID=2666263 RepID=A0ABW2JI05_9ACTN